MFKNVASQKITLLAIDTAANTPKTGDSANITAYVSKDDGAVTVLTDTSASELDATNAPGLYAFDLTQAETNADKLVFSAKSSTSGIRIVPVTVYTDPASFTSHVAQTADHAANITAILADTNELQTDWVNGGRLDLLLDAVKAKTDSLTFTVSNVLDVNVTYVGGVAYAAVTGTADSGTTTTMVDAARTEADADYWAGSWIMFTSGTISGQCRLITGFTPGTDTITFAPATTQAVSTNTYEIIPAARVIGIQTIDEDTTTLDLDATIRAALGLASANLDTQLADLPTVAEFEARTLVAANYFDPAADTVANVTTVGSVTTKTGYALTSDYDFAKGTVAVTEAYAADGAAPTPVQALMLIQQALTEVSISSTTMTIKKLDGSTSAATLTLNDASTPTSKTRAT
jgi:hypothetical protein